MSVFSRAFVVALLLLVCASPSSAITAFWLFLPWGIVTLHEYFHQLPPENQQQTQSAIDQEAPRTFYVPDYDFPVLDVGNVLLPSFSRIPGEVLGAEIVTILLTSMTLLMLFRLIRSPLFSSGKRNEAFSNSSSNLIDDGSTESYGVMITQNAGNLTMSDVTSAVIEADSNDFNGALISAGKLTLNHDNASLERYQKEELVQDFPRKSNLSSVQSNMIDPGSKKSNGMWISKQLISQEEGGSEISHNASSGSVESNSWERNEALVSQNGVGIVGIRESEAWNNNGMLINNNMKDFYKVDWNLIASESRNNSNSLISQEDVGKMSIPRFNWSGSHSLKNSEMLITNGPNGFYHVDWSLLASDSREDRIALVKHEDACIYSCSAVDNNILLCMFMGCVFKQRLSCES